MLAEQWVFHIHRHDDLRKLQRLWPADFFERVKLHPQFDAFTARIKKLPAQRAGETEAAVIRRAAADAEDDCLRAFACRCEKNFPQAEGVELERMKLPRWKHGEADDVGGLDDGGASF